MTLIRYGHENTEFVFCDTLIEDVDLYRFLDDTEKVLGVSIIRLKDGRTPWDVFRDQRYIGNTRTAPCSKILKRDRFERHLIDSGYLRGAKALATIVLGIDWTEEHRAKRAAVNWEPFPVWAPLCEPPFLSKAEIRQWLDVYGIQVPALYGRGFGHNNCRGFCVRAGQAQFANLLRTDREFYLWNEDQEQATLKAIPTARPFLRKVVKGVTHYTTLREFRNSIESGCDYDRQEWGGCGCFVDDSPGSEVPSP
jgi:hypothetical protein